MKSFLFSCFLFFIVSASVHAATFVVDDIRVVGLQRVSAGTVFSAINIKADNMVTEADLQKAIRDLFATGYFNDVKVGRDNDTLVIEVKERSVISKIELMGNKVIPEEALLEGLKSIGLAEGEVFKQSALDAISKQLNAQYSSLGRYSAEIDTVTKEFPQNQIFVEVRIDEGHVAKIKHINIVGNTQFDEDDLRDLFSLNTTGMWSWVTGNDKYAKEKLAGDLERLKSYYLDRGYLKFALTSTQVSLSPDKETVFITVNVDEGEQFTVSDVEIAGDPILEEDELKKLILINSGDTFSQLLVTNTENAIQRQLGNRGYSAAKVSGAPDINVDQQSVKLILYIKPGSISYVRRIIFSGNSATADYVLRREMRQLEGAPVSAEKLELSKTRLQRLGLFSSVNLEIRPVPGVIDQVDVEFIVVEQSTANINFSLGYSGGNGFTVGAGLQHNNWLGSGNTLGFNVDISETEKNYNINFNDPYFTENGVSRGIRLFYRERDFDRINVSNFATDTFGLNVTFGYPISETSRLSLGMGFENISIKAGTVTAQEIQGTPILRDGVENTYVTNEDYLAIVDALGGEDRADTNNNDIIDENDRLPSGVNPEDLPVSYESIDDENAFGSDDFVVRDRSEGFLDEHGDTFDNFSVNLGWSYSSYNRGIFPTKGISQRLNMEIALPGGDLEFYKLTHRNDIYFPIVNSTAFHVRSRLGYGEGYGNLDSLPFFENFFAGGVSSVRGFENSSLGPKATPADAYAAVPVEDGDDVRYVYALDADGMLLTERDGDRNNFGGNVLVELSAELVFPIPFIKENDKARMALFVDSGNVFSSECGSFQENCGNVDLGKLSVATGVSLQWLSPVGPMSFNFSTPLVEQPFDKSEQFQFSLGRSF